MLGSIYNGLTGLLGFSKALDVISNNVANLNTPGFKSSQIQFQDLFYQYQLAGDREGSRAALQMGSGMETGSTSIRFAQGDLRETGTDSDVAIDGNGFFILRKDGETFYTRAGQFEFDQDGFLIDRSNKARVAALGAGNALEDISIIGLQTSPAKATTEIKFLDNLSTGDNEHEITDITIYDTLGASHTIKIKFINNSSATPYSWKVEVREVTGTSDTLLSSGEIRFQGNGSPETGFNTLAFDFAPNGATANTISLNFGDPGSFSGATSFSGGTNSTMRMGSQNGYAAGSLTSASFDEAGYLVAQYSNAQTTKYQRLALASFDYLQGLEQVGGNLFLSGGNQKRTLGQPGEGVMGKLRGRSIELSNVDLTQQFTDMIIVQRGYQGSSQIISVTNEMIQQLFDMRSKRG
jgi:flagellar hook protein FlgE